MNRGKEKYLLDEMCEICDKWKGEEELIRQLSAVREAAYAECNLIQYITKEIIMRIYTIILFLLAIFLSDWSLHQQCRPSKA